MKYKNLALIFVYAILSGLLPTEPIIAVKTISFLLGIGGGLHLMLFLISVAAQHRIHPTGATEAENQESGENRASG